MNDSPVWSLNKGQSNTSFIAIMFCIKGHKTLPSLYFPNEIRWCLRGLSENTWSVYETRVDYMFSGLGIQDIAQLHNIVTVILAIIPMHF